MVLPSHNIKQSGDNGGLSNLSKLAISINVLRIYDTSEGGSPSRQENATIPMGDMFMYSALGHSCLVGPKGFLCRSTF